MLSPRFRSISLFCDACAIKQSYTQNIQWPKNLFDNRREKERKKTKNIEPKFCNRCDTEYTTDTCIDFSHFLERFFLVLVTCCYQKSINKHVARECLGCSMSKNERLSWKLKRQDHHRCGLYCCKISWFSAKNDSRFWSRASLSTDV